jgi:hypothetical protein
MHAIRGLLLICPQLQHVSAATKLVRSLCWATLKPTYLPNGKEVVQLTAWEHIRRKVSHNGVYPTGLTTA